MEFHEDTLSVYQNKKGSLRYFAGAVLISFLCLFIMLYDFSDFEGDSVLISLVYKNIAYVMLIKLAMLVGFALFAYSAAYYLKRAFSPNALLIANRSGITDNSSAVSFGFIAWGDIEKIYIDDVFGNKFIELKIKDEGKYLGSLSWFKKKTIEANKRMGHQIACITLNTTGIAPESILPKLQELFYLYG